MRASTMTPEGQASQLAFWRDKLNVTRESIEDFMPTYSSQGDDYLDEAVEMLKKAAVYISLAETEIDINLEV